MSKVKENLERLKAEIKRCKSAESKVPDSEPEAYMLFRGKVTALQWVLKLDWGEE